MRSRHLIGATLAAAALTAATVTPATAETAGNPSVRLVGCSSETHWAAFKARMGWVSGTMQMGLRFRLFEKQHGGTYHPVHAPRLGRWHRSKPGVGAFAYRQGVRGLQPGGVYRVVVDYRWYDKDGDILQSAHRRSPVCRQRRPLPNLRVHLIGAESTRKQGVLRYHLRVSNVGAAAAGTVPVRLSVDGSVVDTVTVGSLAPGGHRWLTIQGPECTSSVEVRVDPDDAIAESSESDNADSVACDALRHL